MTDTDGNLDLLADRADETPDAEDDDFLMAFLALTEEEAHGT